MALNNNTPHNNTQYTKRPPGRSLRARLVGDPLLTAMLKVMPDFRDCIEEETEHDTVLVKPWWVDSAAILRVDVTCLACERVWKLNTTEAALLGLDSKGQWSGHLAEQDLLDWVTHYLAPFFVEIHDQACFSPRQEEMMAEWLTHRLASAGAKGMPAGQLCHEAVEAGLGPFSEAEKRCNRMGFVEEWVPAGQLWVPKGTEWQVNVVSLPVDHPLRTW